jgi:hypothetical protein
MYQPHEYTQQLLPDSTYKTPYTYPGTIAGVPWNPAQMTTVLSPVRNFQTNFSARIHVGEFSAARYAGGAATYLRDCMNIFEGYGWSWTYHAYREAKVWNLEYADTPVADNGAVRSTVPTDRYNQVVGWGLNLNQ